MNGTKFATSEILRKPVEVVMKGRILASWAQKSPEPWIDGNMAKPYEIWP
jgi:hypothetical protein